MIDPDGRRAGQQLLDEFVEQLALDLPRFMQSSSKEKANTLLQIIGAVSYTHLGDRWGLVIPFLFSSVLFLLLYPH